LVFALQLWLLRGADAITARVYHPYESLVLRTLSNGALRVLCCTLQDGYSALIWAIWNDHMAAAHALVGAGADLNLQDKDSWTALMYASEGDDTAMVQVLLEAGADLNLQTKDGNTALVLATRRGYTSTAQVLIGAGADGSILDQVSAATRPGDANILCLAILFERAVIELVGRLRYIIL
jgi:hypothetical protein